MSFVGKVGDSGFFLSFGKHFPFKMVVIFGNVIVIFGGIFVGLHVVPQADVIGADKQRVYFYNDKEEYLETIDSFIQGHSLLF